MVFEEKMITNGEPDDEEEEEGGPDEDGEGDGEEEDGEGGGEEGEGGDDDEEDEEEEEEEEDMVDPIDAIRQKCEEAAHCVHLRERLEACEGRVNSRSRTEEECTEELFDFLHARDHCVAHKLFHSVK